MITEIYKPIPNTGHLKSLNRTIKIKAGKWFDSNNLRHPMTFNRINSFYGSRVYFLHRFGDDSGNHHFGVHIQLSFWGNQRFLLLQNAHWIQQSTNIKWILAVLIIPAVVYLIGQL